MAQFSKVDIRNLSCSQEKWKDDNLILTHIFKNQVDVFIVVCLNHILKFYDVFVVSKFLESNIRLTGEIEKRKSTIFRQNGDSGRTFDNIRLFPSKIFKLHKIE